MNLDEEVQASSEGEGDDLRNPEKDSSEEESENSEAERQVRQGFIVDDEDAEERRRRKKKKHKRRSTEDADEELDEDDLELIGRGPSDAKYKKLRRIRQASIGSEDLDRPDNLTRDSLNIFDEDDNDRLPTGAGGYEDEMADFIELDPDEEAYQRAQAETANSRQGAGGQRNRGAIGDFQSAMKGIDREAWEEIQEVFGTGLEYDWAMELDGEGENGTAAHDKAPSNLQDVFEPAIIQERMMTDQDDFVRQLDVPERMQMLSISLLGKSTQHGLTTPLLSIEELDDATTWIAPLIEPRLTEEYFAVDINGNYNSPLRMAFLTAVRFVLEEMHIKFREAPFIWLHRRDYLVNFSNTSQNNSQANGTNVIGGAYFLERDHLWKIQQLSYEYRSLLDRKHGLQRLWNKLGRPNDPYFDDFYRMINSLEDAADLHEWINIAFSQELRALKDRQEDQVKMEGGSAQTVKRVKPMSSYERAKNSIVARLAVEMAIDPRTLIQAALTSAKPPDFKDDPPATPLEYASQFAQPGTLFPNAEVVLSAAKNILIHEIKSDPYFRKEIRRRMNEIGIITIRPTESGKTKIDEHHPYYPFKYIFNKPIAEQRHQPSFLAMLAAEAEDLIKITIGFPPDKHRDLVKFVEDVYLSDFESSAAHAWNGLRQDILKAVFEDEVIPAVASWIKKRLKDEAEQTVYKRCRAELAAQIECAPFRGSRMEKGEVPSVVAVSFGKGDVRHDSVVAIYLDSMGRFRDQLKVDSLQEPLNTQFGRPIDAQAEEQREIRETQRESFLEFLFRHKPDVVVIGGFTYATKDLYLSIEKLLETLRQRLMDQKQWSHDEATIPQIFVRDATARLYQHSKRAEDDYPQMSSLARYCVGLARFVQSAINEYTALGDDILSVTFDPYQKYLDKERVLLHLQTALVDNINAIGVDVNLALRDPYYATLLPFIAGLGPRKAHGVLQEIRKLGGTLVSRVELLNRRILRDQVFVSAAAFLRIDQSSIDSASYSPDDGPDVLDSTRIHNEDYDIARKMASDAEELDEEDIAALSHPSDAVKQLMEGRPQKLNDLRLDDFAVELQRLMGIPKRLTLYLIKEELQNPYSEVRSDYQALSQPEIFKMISGETEQTLHEGLVVPVVIVKPPTDHSSMMRVRLESGVDGVVAGNRIVDQGQDMPIYVAGQTIRALVIAADFGRLLEGPRLVQTLSDSGPSRENWQRYTVELDARPSEVGRAEGQFQNKNALDPYFDASEEKTDLASYEALKKRTSGRQKRLITHRNFKNFNAGQAEHYLSSQPRGECVIRPSSMGTDHLACTWKVDDGVYSHLQIMELNKPDGNPLALGAELLLDGGKTRYHDLDELIVNHVRALANKVEEMMAHEKYKGTDDDLLTSLRNYQMAHPDKPTYGFSIDKKRPGQFNLTFITKKGGQPKTWPVKLAPKYYQLFEAEVPTVQDLCNAFKTQIMQLSHSSGGATSRTPYNANQGRATPAYAYGRTPNAYIQQGYGQQSGYSTAYR